MELTKEVRHNRAVLEDLENRRSGERKAFREELLGAVDTLKGELLGAIGTLTDKVLAISADARAKHDSYTSEHTTEITGVHAKIVALAEADARIETAQSAEIAALKRADKALASRLRWRIGGIVSGLITFGLALWKIFETIPR